jgi:hypothetical protein
VPSHRGFDHQDRALELLGEETRAETACRYNVYPSTISRLVA